MVRVGIASGHTLKNAMQRVWQTLCLLYPQRPGATQAVQYAVIGIESTDPSRLRGIRQAGRRGGSSVRIMEGSREEGEERK